MNERSDWFTLLLAFGCLVFLAVPADAQNVTGQTRSVTVGETFAVNLPVQSSFHQWELTDYDVRKVSLSSKRPAETVGNYRFQFDALEAGQAQLVFTRKLSTAISTEDLESRTITVTVQQEGIDSADTVIENQSPSPVQPEVQEAPSETVPQDPSDDEFTVQEDTFQAEPEEEEPDEPDIDWTTWNQVQELLETEHYEKAGELIQEQVGRSAGEARQRWRELQAESFMQQDRYEDAIGVWEDMVQEFRDGPQAKWLMSVARAHRKNGSPDQAELALLEIRHRHPGSPQWPTAMKQLAEMALERNEVERARKILESARSRLAESEHPDVLMELAEIYDKFPTTRNYYKAVKLYQTAARRFDASDTRSAAAKDRADYLKENFLNFGIQ